jgi:hypothetical protein
VLVEVSAEQVAKESGNSDDPASMVLGGAEVEFAPGF